MRAPFACACRRIAAPSSCIARAIAIFAGSSVLEKCGPASRLASARIRDIRRAGPVVQVTLRQALLPPRLTSSDLSVRCAALRLGPGQRSRATGDLCPDQARAAVRASTEDRCQTLTTYPDAGSRWGRSSASRPGPGSAGQRGGRRRRRPSSPRWPRKRRRGRPRTAVATARTTRTPRQCPLHYEGDRHQGRRRGEGRSACGARCATGCSPPGPSSAARRRPRSSRSG